MCCSGLNGRRELESLPQATDPGTASVFSPGQCPQPLSQVHPHSTGPGAPATSGSWASLCQWLNSLHTQWDLRASGPLSHRWGLVPKMSPRGQPRWPCRAKQAYSALSTLSRLGPLIVCVLRLINQWVFLILHLRASTECRTFRGQAVVQANIIVSSWSTHFI